MNLLSFRRCLAFILAATTSLCMTPFSFAADAQVETQTWRSPLQKQGYLNSPVVEITPFVLNDRLYLMESWQAFFDVPDVPPGTGFEKNHARIRDVETDEIVSTTLPNSEFATAFVWEGRVYVFAGVNSPGKPWREITKVMMTSSADLKTWTEPVLVLEAEGDELIYNTAVCRGKDGFVLLYETNDSRWPAFTFKYCVGDDLIHWKRVDGALYGTDKYVGGPALYYEGDWYYTLYLESLGSNHYETRITRSRDLKTWHDAPAGRPFVTFDPEHKNMPRRPKEIAESNASDAEVCYFKGQSIIYYTGNDQQVCGDLQWATFDGTPRELFEAFFE